MVNQQHAPKRKDFQDLTGNTYAELFVLEYAGITKSGHSLWKCRCECCGTEKVLAGSDLKRKKARKTSCTCSKPRPGHERENRIWANMRYRCENTNCNNYDKYGGRGIKVCERWQNFSNFLADMGPCPSPKHSIDRFPNNDGNYEIGNCRWATRKEQANNRAVTTFIELNGVKRPLTEWAELLGILVKTLDMRFRRGWPPERILMVQDGRSSRKFR